MAGGIKVATIGGGSSYTPELVEGFIKRHENLPVDELWLVDIPEGQEKLDTVGALAQRMVKRAGLPTKVILTTDRRAALDGADFVTSQVRIGRLPARVLDERIPLSHACSARRPTEPAACSRRSAPSGHSHSSARSRSLLPSVG